MPASYVIASHFISARAMLRQEAAKGSSSDEVDQYTDNADCGTIISKIHKEIIPQIKKTII